MIIRLKLICEVSDDLEGNWRVQVERNSSSQIGFSQPLKERRDSQSQVAPNVIFSLTLHLQGDISKTAKTWTWTGAQYKEVVIIRRLFEGQSCTSCCQTGLLRTFKDQFLWECESPFLSWLSNEVTVPDRTATIVFAVQSNKDTKLSLIFQQQPRWRKNNVENNQIKREN